MNIYFNQYYSVSKGPGGRGGAYSWTYNYILFNMKISKNTTCNYQCFYCYYQTECSTCMTCVQSKRII